jgi:hypothetical protein
MTRDALPICWPALCASLALALACDDDGLAGSTATSLLRESHVAVVEQAPAPGGPFDDDDDDDDETCEFEGETYEIGETWPLDECNVCVCTVDGPYCTFMLCLDEETCEHAGETYEIGEIWPLDECNVCVCTADGPYCTFMLCRDDNE